MGKYSDKEQKAKEFVDFYYFWLFHYCSRNYWREIVNFLSPKSKLAIGTYSDEQENIVRKIYYAHPLYSMEPCFSYEEMIFREIDELFFETNGASLSKPHQIIEALYNGELLDRVYYKRNTFDSFRVIGTNGAYVSKDGNLRGKLLAEIDLSASISSIIYELSKIKGAKFLSFPNFLDSPQRYDIQENYILNAEIIKEATDASFSKKDDAARAIGLWIWDTLEGESRLCDSFSELWSLICTKEHKNLYIYDNPKLLADTPDIEKITADIDNTDDEFFIKDDNNSFFCVIRKDAPTDIYYVPTLKVFSKLGYAVSDPSVFRRLYRNTKKCIDACEVLSLK